MSLKALNKAKALKKQRINGVINELDEDVIRAQKRLHRELSEKFVNRLTSTVDGLIPVRDNRRFISRIERIFADFKSKEEMALLKKFVSGVDEILEINTRYYEEINPAKNLARIAKTVKKEVREMLGIGEKNQIIANGYLDKLVKSPAAQQKVKKLALKNLGGSFKDMRDSMRDLVVGDKKNYGLMQGYYRNYAYDTISQSDAVAGNKFADHLGLNFAEYSGGLIATSRDFCRKRNGKVFHRSQIAKWRPEEARQPDYDPFIHLGGYGCRHFFNWVSDEMAVYLDEGMKKFVKQQEKK